MTGAERMLAEQATGYYVLWVACCSVAVLIIMEFLVGLFDPPKKNRRWR